MTVLRGFFNRFLQKRFGIVAGELSVPAPHLFQGKSDNGVKMRIPDESLLSALIGTGKEEEKISLPEVGEFPLA